MARSTFSLGILAPLAARMAVRSRGFDAGSPPPMRAAMLISRMMRVNTRPRFASVAPFLCLMVAHFECPDISHPSLSCLTAKRPYIGNFAPAVRAEAGVPCGDVQANRKTPTERVKFSTAPETAKPGILSQGISLYKYQFLPHILCLAMAGPAWR